MYKLISEKIYEQKLYKANLKSLIRNYLFPGVIREGRAGEIHVWIRVFEGVGADGRAE